MGLIWDMIQPFYGTLMLFLIFKSYEWNFFTQVDFPIVYQMMVPSANQIIR